MKPSLPRRPYVSLLTLAACLGLAVATPSFALNFEQLVQSVEAERAPRYEPFRNFQIKGICGTTRLEEAAAWGANTLRTYTPPTRAQLDDYQRLGLKVIVGIWMPHQGENKGGGGKWSYDYTTQGDKQLKDFAAVIERIGDHPAILMWCLGNEVHLDPPYLKTVNLMSRFLHEKHPKQLTSLTMVNAPKEKVALIKELAPDLDVIGYNSYGQGAVNGASRTLEEVWGRAYYVSEFGPQGPWSGRKTAWGAKCEQSYDAKIEDLRKSLVGIDAAPRCLGSTMFLWGVWQKGKEFPTYFSAFLSPELGDKTVADEKLYVTPIADEFHRYWSGSYPAERAPILSSISIAGSEKGHDAIVPAGKKFPVIVTATDPSASARPLRYRWWILDHNGKVVQGPQETDQPTAEFMAPATPGEAYAMLVYVVAGQRFASGFSAPFKVE